MADMEAISNGVSESVALVYFGCGVGRHLNMGGGDPGDPVILLSLNGGMDVAMKIEDALEMIDALTKAIAVAADV